jgi:hypothetical protein
MSERMEMSTFEGRVGERFAIALSEGGQLELKLAEVSGVTAGEPGAGAFSLLFEGGPADKFLAQRMYEVQHQELGTLPIFLVPLGPKGGVMTYQAIFA